jgi:hypothetical protein
MKNKNNTSLIILRSNKEKEILNVLNTYLKWVVEDCNKVRPHYKHRPRTPNEVYFGIPHRVKHAISQKVKKNKCVKCIQCTGCKLHKTINHKKKSAKKRSCFR